VQQVPQVSIAQQNLKIMQSFCSEFGLTPATRARIIAAGGGSDDTFSSDPMETLLKGGWTDGV
jgi:phage terminase small subunit